MRGAEIFDLGGRVVLVTGGGQGVGAALARGMAACGAAVVVNDVDVARATHTVDAIREAGGRATSAIGDVTVPEGVEAMVRDVAGSTGPIDVLVNNAGVPQSGLSRRPFVDTGPDDWAPLIDLNLTGVLLCTKSVLKSMCDRGWGRVITVVSDAGKVGEPGYAAYSAAKAGAMGFSRTLAGEVGQYGVTCNCLSLGAIAPPVTDDERAKQAQRYPMRRLGVADDVVGPAIWLASNAAAWVTGQSISVNGGYVTS